MAAPIDIAVTARTISALLNSAICGAIEQCTFRIKTKAYEESKVQLDNTQALDALVSCFRRAENNGQEKEKRHSYFSPLRKRLVLGTIIDKQGGADGRKA
jgi:hypothetical protein